MPQCIDCLEDLPLDAFYKRASASIGRYKNCKLCRKAYYDARPKITVPTVESKACSVCRVEKPRSEFHRQTRSSTGLQSACKECGTAIERAAKYQMSIEEVTQIMRDPDAHCAICDSRDRAALVFDHCHTSGKFRDLLCGSCNLVLGHAKDDPARLIKAAQYLAQHGVQQ